MGRQRPPFLNTHPWKALCCTSGISPALCQQAEVRDNRNGIKQRNGRLLIETSWSVHASNLHIKILLYCTASPIPAIAARCLQHWDAPWDPSSEPGAEPVGQPQSSLSPTLGCSPSTVGLYTQSGCSGQRDLFPTVQLNCSTTTGISTNIRTAAQG